MKIGDLVLCKYDDLKGIVVSPPFRHAEMVPPGTYGINWVWVYTTHAPHLEHIGKVYPWRTQQLELLSESR
jgi:hypothetical protein